MNTISPSSNLLVSRRSLFVGISAGLLISAALSAALVIAGAKAGIIPGVSPLVVLFAWLGSSRSLVPSERKGLLALIQVVGSAGAAVTAGVVFTAGIIQIISKTNSAVVPPVDIPMVTLASLAGVFLGWGFVGLSAKRMLQDKRLPAPEAVACDRLIQTAIRDPEKRPPVLQSLGAGLLGGVTVAALTSFRFLSEEVTRIKVHSIWGTTVPIPISPLYLGIGALLTLPTALLIFSGGLCNALVVGYAEANAMPATTFRWVGAAAMVVAVLYSLVCYAIDWRQSMLPDKESALASEGSELLELDVAMRRSLYASIGLGSVLFSAILLLSALSWLQLLLIVPIALALGFLLTGIGGLLSLQVGSSASPVSGTVFVALLVLSLLGLIAGLEGLSGIAAIVPVVVALCVAICAANDSSQDYKTMQLNGLLVRQAYFGQLVGLLVGALVVPATLWLAHESFVLGSEALPAPQASFFATVLGSLFLSGQVPWGAVLAGSIVGLIAIGVESLGKRRGLILSSLAFAVGIYLPSVIGTGIVLGSLCRFVAMRKSRHEGYEGILTAAGLISGDAIFSLCLAIAIVFGYDTAVERMPYPTYVGGAFLIVLCLLIFRTFRLGSARTGLEKC